LSIPSDEPRQYEQPAVKVKPSSRLIVKNIPKHITDARLKAHFATKGEVTDVKILKTKYVAPPVALPDFS
jgi:RNA recognition motif-containing protein